MKRIYFLIVLTALALSCTEEAKLSSQVSADRVSMSFDGQAPVAETIQVSADGQWYAYSPEWIKVTPSHGNGNTIVSVEPQKNVDVYGDLCAPRADEIAFWSTPQSTVRLAVSQSGEPGLDVSGEYTLLTKTEDFDPSRGVIIAAWDGKTYNAALPFAASSESEYSYLSSEAIAPEDGVIKMNSLRLTWRLIDTDGGLALQEPNGRYLFMSPAYANFYSTTDISKADRWTVSIGSDGLVDIIDSNVGKLLQYGPEYTTFGGYASLQSFGVKVSLFMDSKSASPEILNVASSYLVSDSSTSLTIPVQADSVWKVRCHDQWVTSCTATEDAINLTFDVNPSADKDRDATLIVIGRTKFVEVKVRQSRRIENLGGLKAYIRNGATSFSGQLDSAVVSYVNGKNAFLRDDNTGILLYSASHGLSVGDVIKGAIEGTCTLYNALPELTALTADVAGKVADVQCDTLNLATLLSDYDRYLGCPIYIKDIVFEKGISAEETVGSISQDGKSVGAKLKVKTFSIDAGQSGDLYCIPEVSGATKLLGVWEESHFRKND